MPASTDPVTTALTNPGPLTERASRNVTTVHTPTQVPNSTASQPGWTVLDLSHCMVAYSSVSGGSRLRVGQPPTPGTTSRTGGESNPFGSPHRMNEELSAKVGEIMRKLVVLTRAAVVATALVGGPALPAVAPNSKPPGTAHRQGTNNGKATAKNRKVT